MQRTTHTMQLFCMVKKKKRRFFFFKLLKIVENELNILNDGIWFLC